jgi:Zn-dependent alcohol dehydrogenase
MERIIKVDVNPTACELAESFCDLDNYEQAKFFNVVAQTVDTWDMGFEFQLQDIVDSGILTQDAKRIMKLIGDYAE